jgi:hypothetical protein
MAKKVISMTLSEKSIQNAIKQLRDYQNSLEYKCSLLAQKLADRGIEVARNNTGNFGHYITFEKKVIPEKNGCTAIIVAKDIAKIISQWKTADGIKSAEVSPLLMVEFGSGYKAKNPKNVQGVGQGTFPNQTHAFDDEGWYWVDLDGNLNHSYGIEPKMPMFNASIEIQNDINSVVKEVFG